MSKHKTNLRSSSVNLKTFQPFNLTIPVSITYFTPGIVIDVSAIFVANMILRCPGSAGLKAFNCMAGGRAANKGQTFIFGKSRKQGIGVIGYQLKSVMTL